MVELLKQRPRRLRQREPFRRLVRETRLTVDQLVMPLFVRPGKNVRAPIPAMPGQFQLSVDQVVKECQELHDVGVPMVLLFGSIQPKDERATHAYAKDGIVQQAVREIKARVPDLLITTDVCVCGAMTHGHCGVVRFTNGLKRPAGGTRRTLKKGRKARAKGTRAAVLPQPESERDFWIDNDATVALLARTAVSHAQAGVDVVAPSDMMDGRVRAIRGALNAAGFSNLPIMSYAAKFASAFYGPFREAVGSAPAFGDRQSYQLDAANVDEALREVALDIEEGADMIMVKPALAYLDVIYRVKERFGHPVAAFSVSGEYAMIKAAATRGWLIERPTWLEVLLAIRRAGADILITYWAKEAARFLQDRKVRE